MGGGGGGGGISGCSQGSIPPLGTTHLSLCLELDTSSNLKSKKVKSVLTYMTENHIIFIVLRGRGCTWGFSQGSIPPLGITHLSACLELDTSSYCNSKKVKTIFMYIISLLWCWGCTRGSSQGSIHVPPLGTCTTHMSAFCNKIYSVKKVMDYNIQWSVKPLFPNRFSKKRISYCSATTVRWKTVVFENPFMKKFCVGAVENRKGHSKKRANLHR